MTTAEIVLAVCLVLNLLGLLVLYFLYTDLRSNLRYESKRIDKKVNESMFEFYRDNHGERLEKHAVVLDQLLDRMGLEVYSQQASTFVRKKAQ